MGKTLKCLGMLALVGWTLAGFVAFGLASKNVRIVFGEEDSAHAEQVELASLDDRVDVLSEDLRGLAAAMGENFGALIDQMEADRSSRLAEAKLSSARVSDPAPVASQELAAPETAAESVEPARSKSFLSFKLPSSDFSFHEERTFQVLSSLSRVGFDGKSTIHDFTGVADKLEGSFTVNLGQPNRGIEGELRIRASGILTGSDGRDSAMYEHLDVENFEFITFRFDSFEQGTVNEAEESLDGRAHGRMTIRGVEREMVMSVRAHMDSSRRLVVEGEMPLSQAEFKVPVPAKLGMISMEDEVRVWVNILARPEPREEKN